MKEINQELQEAISNINTFKQLISTKADQERKNSLLSLVSSLEETLILAPASTRTDYLGAYPGGLVKHSLNVLKFMSTLNQAYGSQLPSESLIVTGLFHDIGKCGDETGLYYLPKNSEWHNKQGIMYEINPAMIDIPVSLRSLFILQRHGIKLSRDEHYAISSIKDRVRSTDNNLVVHNEPMLAIVLQQAIRVALTGHTNKPSTAR